MNHDKFERRIERTREAIFGAFRDLVLTRGYEKTTVFEVIDRANVGRSTFYEHFENKEHLLGESLAPLLRALGTVDDSQSSVDAVTFLFHHFLENRESNAGFFAGSMGAVVTTFLAAAIEAELSNRLDDSPAIPLTLAAATLAAAQIAFVNAWIRDPSAITAEIAAARLCASAVASATSLLGVRIRPRAPVELTSEPARTQAPQSGRDLR